MNSLAKVIVKVVNGVPTRSVKPVVWVQPPKPTTKRVWIGSGDSDFPSEHYNNPKVAQSHTGV